MFGGVAATYSASGFELIQRVGHVWAMRCDVKKKDVSGLELREFEKNSG